MISVVFKKELLSHLLSRQFAICTALAVLLMSTNGLVSSQNWSLKKASYQAKKAVEVQKPRDITYYGVLAADTQRSDRDKQGIYKTQVAPRALRAPRPLELFAQGDEARLGQAVPVLLFEVPYLAEQVDPLTADNHFLALFNTYDMVYVFQLVLGLLAILMASETISSEKEAGTLRLTLTTNISRAQLLAGKLLGGVTTLAIPTALGFIILMIILLGTDGADVSLAAWWGMGVLFLLSLLYLTVLYLIGLVVSCATGRSATSLVYALFLWALLVVVLPNTIAALLNERANMNEKNDQADAHAAQVWDELEQNLQDLVRTHGQRRYPPIELVERKTGRMMIDFGSKPELYMNNIADTPGLATFQDIFRSGELLRLQYAQRAWNAQAPFVETFPRRLARQNAQLQRLFPAGAYAQAASAIAGTSQEEFYGFIEQVRDYRRQLLGYLKDRDAFGSRTYFNDDSGWEANLSDMPRFQEQQATSYQRLRQSLPALAGLLLYAAGLFVLANRLFARYNAA
ncbi:MAG: ABC transporter permease subunit [Gemmatimonadetes bacterium]|nr:ABC transporter permease subunit [Gemmatimonadota bacterium]MYB68690.1 ABC transporter permease subunit [Gemmatimonadota bacterium]